MFGNNICIDANVSVIPEVNIGKGYVITAGSVITKNIPDNSLAAGVSAKVIKEIQNQ